MRENDVGGDRGGDGSGRRPGAVEIVGFEIGGHQVGIPAGQVVEVISAVLSTPLPSGPPILEGVINLRGVLAPVFAVGERLGLATTPLRSSDFLIVARRQDRDVLLRAAGLPRMLEVRPDQISDADRVAARPLAGIASTADGVLLLCDLDAFLSEAEAEALEAALQAADPALAVEAAG